MAYTLVQFSDGQQVVLTKWIFENDDVDRIKCFYPPMDTYERSMKKNLDVNDEWKVCDVIEILLESGKPNKLRI